MSRSAAAPSSVNSKASPQLPTDIAELVQELAVAVHKRGIYPASHPMLHGAVDSLHARLEVVLAKRAQLALGVSRRRLVIDGIETDDGNMLLADLAERLYAHELGVVSFLAGARRTTLDEFISAISVSPTRGVEPFGAGGRSQLTRWPDLVLTRVAFDRLELKEDTPDLDALGLEPPRATELWLGLARATMEGDSLDGSLEDPKKFAQSVSQQVRGQGYDAALLAALRTVISELGDLELRDSLLRQRVSDLVQHLDDATISKLLQVGGDAKAGAAFLERACESLTAAAVVRLTRVAATDAGVPIAGAMLRLLSKLARDADSRRLTSRTVDRALRMVIRKMLANWHLVDPNPEAYSAVLSTIATTSSEVRPDLGRDNCEHERILQIGIASESIGPAVEAALAGLIATTGVAGAVDCLLACEASEIRDSLVDRLINESTFRDELAAERPAVLLLQHAVARLGARAVPLLVAELERRGDGDAGWIVDLLARIGSDGITAIGEQLADRTPRALRHLLTVFDRCDEWPPASDPLDYLRHADVGVRRECVRFVLRREATRDRGILAGLRDPDIRIFNLALAAMTGACSAELARSLMARTETSELSDELRARAIRVLGETSHVEVRVWMEKRATTTHWLFRSVRLRKPSLELSAIVTALAARPGDRAESRRILTLARRSRDRGLRRAAMSQSELEQL